MRKLATAAAVSLALASGGAFGLGLGEIEMRSALNQPMNAEIRLTAVKPGELDGMIVQLASEDAFARAGLERSTVLRDLDFSVDNSGPEPVIRIVSQRPVVEPFLNFLLEVDWPQGRMVREYTVLLDPPVFMTPSATDRNISSDQPTLVERGNEALIVPTPIERAIDNNVGEEVDLLALAPDTAALPDQGEIVSLQPIDDSALLSGDVNIPDGGEIVSLTDLAAPNTAAIDQRELEAQEAFDINSFDVELVGSEAEIADDFVVGGQAGQAASENNNASSDGSTVVSLDDLDLANQSTGSNSSAAAEVTVNRGDTLFEIARDNSVSGVSVQQMMMALLAANESAFINNNINLVRAGAELRIPNSDEASRLTQTQALAAIGQQDQLWQEYRDQLRGNAGTQLAESSRSDSSLAGIADVPTESIDTASLDEEATDGLSSEARAILDNARNEILNRDELKIVADNAPSSTTASATADETSDNDSERLGALNRKLQLAREELSSTRLQSEDLSEQAGELQSTSDNLDALVSLRQNEVAQLEAQLATARAAEEAAATATAAGADATDAAGNVADAATDAAGNVADAATDAAGSVVDAATDAAGNVADAATDASGNVVDAATDAAGNVADGAQDLVADASSVIGNAAGTLGESADDVVESGTNALTEAGETLAEVELIDDEADTAAVQAEAEAEAEATIAPPVKQTTWYEDFLNDPKRLMIAGIGGIGLLGVLGTLLFRRKRREGDDDSMLDFDEDIEFIDDSEAADLHAEMQSQSPDGTSDINVAGAGVAAAGAAALGGVMAAGASAKDKFDDTASLTGAFDDMADSSQDLGSETQAVADATADDTLDKDDTISEVDVYLAYGLHGQAEELLVKAIDRKPNQPEYAHKLLQTYHAQGNSEGFHTTAEGFHARFGGDSNPEWAGIAAMGAELRPEEPLYSGAGLAGIAGVAGVAAIGTGDSDGLKFEADDFLPAHDDASGSVSRGFGDDQAIDLDGVDETDLLDQSLDPAFAFDEADLEATGDFSEIANEISAEADDGSIEFPNFDDAPGIDMDATLSEVLDDDDSSLGDALTMDELDGLGAPGDDLTLDLDQLSGDLELDTSELLDSDLSDLEIPELTADNDLLLSEVSTDANNADEMDTMLDLAKAYIDMGDKDSASSALGEIVKSGSPEQVNEAETLLRNIS